MFTKIHMFDTKKVRVIYDFSTKKFIAYNNFHNDRFSNWIVAICWIGWAVLGIGLDSLGLLGKRSRSRPWGPKCVAFKDRPDFVLIVFAFIAVTIILYFLFRWIGYKNVTSGGLEQSNISSFHRVKSYYGNNYYTDESNENDELEDDEETDEHEFDEAIFSMIFLFILLIAGFVFLFFQKYLVGVMALSLILPPLSALYLCVLMIMIQETIVLKKYNLI